MICTYIYISVTEAVLRRTLLICMIKILNRRHKIARRSACSVTFLCGRRASLSGASLNNANEANNKLFGCFFFLSVGDSSRDCSWSAMCMCTYNYICTRDDCARPVYGLWCAFQQAPASKQAARLIIGHHAETHGKYTHTYSHATLVVTLFGFTNQAN